MIKSSIQIIDPSIVISIFNRYKVESKTVKPFMDFDENIQDLLLQSIALNRDERPTLLSFTNSNCWLLLTTERLIWQQNQETRWIFYTEIDSVDIDRSSIPEQGAHYKTEGKDIEVQTSTGQKLTLHTGETGAVRLALLNVVGWTLQKIKSSS